MQRQLEEFKSWGVMGDWENRWLTMGTVSATFAWKLSVLNLDREYEVRQLEVFLEMVAAWVTKRAEETDDGV